MLATTVLIIGAGVTGTGLARDMALRGISSIVVDKTDINAGASGGNHGLLHSGARYVCGDVMAAVECREEGEILKKLAPHCIEDTGGLFVAVAGDDERYVADFALNCQKAGVACREVDARTAREMEPVLSRRITVAYEVPDASVDPFRLSLDNMAHAGQLGARFMPMTRVVGLRVAKSRIVSAQVQHVLTGEVTGIEVEQVVNAAGAWAGEILALVDREIDLIFSKGTLLVTSDRISSRVINRLRPAADSDILVPGGTVSILGTTSVRAAHPEDFRPTTAEVDAIIDDAKAMVPVLDTTRYIRAYARIRPLFGCSSNQDDRGVSRGFALLDHEAHGLENFLTITGGKLSTFRLMAEKTADLLCAKLGRGGPCQTKSVALPSFTSGKWTEPGSAPREWMRRKETDEKVICECEIVPQSVIEEILADMPASSGNTLLSIGLRSRVGKGPCQGGLCAIRLSGHLYDRGLFSRDQGLEEMRIFLEERWRGIRPIVWGYQEIQAEFQEALHCGLFDLELNTNMAREGLRP
jgi:glycerol-3-phosphate dehydrogenase